MKILTYSVDLISSLSYTFLPCCGDWSIVIVSRYLMKYVVVVLCIKRGLCTLQGVLSGIRSGFFFELLKFPNFSMFILGDRFYLYLDFIVFFDPLSVYVSIIVRVYWSLSLYSVLFNLL